MLTKFTDESLIRVHDIVLHFIIFLEDILSKS